jgi:hypothetical protein
MTNKRTILLTSKAARQRTLALVVAAPEGYAVTIGEETRSQEQNRLMWPLIKDVRDQVEDQARFTPEQMKLRFLNALDNEMQFLPELEGGGMFAVGQRSSTLTKGDFSMLLELIFQYGAQHGVRWSVKSEETRASMGAMQ